MKNKDFLPQRYTYMKYIIIAIIIILALFLFYWYYSSSSSEGLAPMKGLKKNRAYGWLGGGKK